MRTKDKLQDKWVLSDTESASEGILNKKMFLKNLQESTCATVSFLNQVAGLGLQLC